jgi:hypothetical protein
MEKENKRAWKRAWKPQKIILVNVYSSSKTTI